MIIIKYLAPLCMLLSFITFVWLTVRAFKWHPGWGFAVMLLSPISATAFGVSHWRNEKMPFLAYISTFIAAIGLCLDLFTAWGGWDVVRTARAAVTQDASQQANTRDVLEFIKASISFVDNTGQHQVQQIPELMPELATQLQEANTGNAADSVETPAGKKEEYVKLNRKVKPKVDRFRLVYKPVKVSDARKYVGATMKVTRKNVGEKEYRLVSASPTGMEFSQRNKHGSFSLNFRNSEIEKIRVLMKEPY